MKGAKGGKRDRIISFLFSKKNEHEQEQKTEVEKENNKRQNNTEKKIVQSDKKEETNDFANPRNNIFDATEETYSNDSFNDEKDSLVSPIHEEKNHSINNDNTKENYLLEDTAEFIPIQQEETYSETKKENKNQPQSYTHVTNKTEISSQISRQNENNEKVIEYSVPIPQSENESIDNEQDLIEKSVVEALERIIKEDIYELEQIQYELEILKQKEDDEALTDEVEKLKQRLEEIIKKFEKIKDIYYKSISSEDLTKIDDDELYRLVVDYKENYKDSNLIEVVETEIKVIESYVSLIEQIILVEQTKDEIDEKIDEKLDKFKIRDEEFEEMKKDYENIEEISNVVESFNSEQEKIMKELEEKMRKSEEITTRIETTMNVIPHFNRLIQAAIMISLSKRVPPTPRGNLIKAGLIINAINMAAHFITTEEKQNQVTTIKYQDFANDLKSIGKDIDDIIYKIDGAFNNIDLIRENFKKSCEEYAGQIPEYDEFMKNLDKIEKELKEKQDIAKKYSKDFDKMLEKNNQKVKRLEMQDNTQLVA